jgi:hypothetical protein
MTEDQGRRTEIVPVQGRNVVIRELRDLQIMHLGRLASILSNGNVDNGTKMEATAQMLDILHTVVVQDDDRKFLVKAEMDGEIGLDDLMEFVNAFPDESDTEEKPAVKRSTRGPRARR